MKASLRSSRTGLAKHNDRSFDFVNSGDGHIDPSRVNENIYISYKNIPSFQEAELAFYQDHYSEWLTNRNEKCVKQRNFERVRTMQEVLSNERTKPDELILQIGDFRKHPDPELFTECVKDFLKTLEPYQEHFHIIDVAIHKDEATPHAHIRSILDYTDESGLRQISQEKSLEAMGFERPDLTRKNSVKNNRKIAFHAELRKKWYDICESRGIEIDRTPDMVNRVHKNKDEWIIDDLNKQVNRLKSENELLQKRVMELEQEKKRWSREKTR